MAKIQLSANEVSILENSIDLLNNKIAQDVELRGELEERIIDYSLEKRGCRVCANNCTVSCYTGCEGDCAGTCDNTCKTGCEETCHTAYYSSG
jgi:hypothetical protein